MSNAAVECPGCGLAETRRNGRDRRGQQRFRCDACRRRFTALTGTPCSGYRFPPDVIALAVRWYLRFRLSYADVAELLAERGVRVDPSTVYAWVQEFAPLDEDAARSFRRAIGSCWSAEIVGTQMAKADGFGARAGGDDVADLDVAIRHDDAVDEQFDQLAPLREGRAGQTGLDALAERLDGAHHAGDLRLAIGLRRELLAPAAEPLALLLRLAPAPLVRRERHGGPERGRPQPRQLPVELALGAAEVLLPRLQLLGQPCAARGAR